MIVFLLLTACGDTDRGVVVYTSHDRNLSEPLLQVFSRKTGITVRAQYDVEANKTVGLVNRLIAEANHPRADLFWNNEVAQTIRLSRKGLLAPVSSESPGAVGRPYSDAQGYWQGFGARARVFIVNQSRARAEGRPTGLADLVRPEWRGKAAFADPHFGTTGTHFSALYAHWGEPAFRSFVRALKVNKTAMLPGNSQVKDAVVAGTYLFGLTDTDDTLGAVADQHPVELLIPDQQPGGMGVFLIPNTVSLIRGGPNPSAAQQLADFLVSSEAEQILSAGRGAQIPVQSDAAPPHGIPPLAELILHEVDYESVASAFEPMLEVFRQAWYE